MKIQILVLCLIGLICSCNSKQQKNSESSNSLAINQDKEINTGASFVEINFKAPEKNKFTNIALSDIVSDVEYVQLEMNSDCTLGDHFSIKLTSEFIFIGQLGEVLMFDRGGKFIRKMNKKGRGPNEFVSGAFTICELNKHIYMYSIYGHEIFKFDFEGNLLGRFDDPVDGKSGEFIESLAIDKETGNLIITYKNSFGNSKYKMSVIDKSTGNEVKLFLNNDIYVSENKISTFSGTVGKTVIYNFDNYSHYKADFNDTIYRINNLSLKPRYLVNLGAKKVTLEDYIEFLAGSFKSDEIEDKIFILGFYETETKLYLMYFVHRIHYFGIYDKETKDFVQDYNGDYILNDIDGGFPLDMVSIQDLTFSS